MKARLLVALAAGLLVGAADPVPDWGEVPQPQVIPLGSRWREAGSGAVWEFRKDGILQIKSAGGERLSVAFYTLNWKANPPRLDLSDTREAIKGIYRVEGDNLLICQPIVTSGNRPTRFIGEPDAEQYLYSLKRLK